MKYPILPKFSLTIASGKVDGNNTILYASYPQEVEDVEDVHIILQMQDDNLVEMGRIFSTSIEFFQRGRLSVGAEPAKICIAPVVHALFVDKDLGEFLKLLDGYGIPTEILQFMKKELTHHPYFDGLSDYQHGEQNDVDEISDLVGEYLRQVDKITNQHDTITDFRYN